MATVNIITSPDQYSVVAAPMWFQAQSASASAPDFKYLFDIYELDQSNSSVMSYLGRYFVPSAPNGDGLFTPNRVLNSVVSHDINWDTTTFIQATHSIVQYRTKYGFQYDPDLHFFSTYNNGGFLGLNFDVTINPTPVQVGDVLFIDKDTKSINGDYDGSTTLTSKQTNYSYTTDRPFGVAASNEAGEITLLTRIVGTFSDLYGFNGTRQYLQRTFNFGSVNNYLMGSSQSKFLSYYETRQGREYPVFATQSQSVSFLAQSGSYSLPAYIVNTYNSNYSLLNTYGIPTGITPNYRRWDGPAGPHNLEQLGVTFSGVSYYNVGFGIGGGSQDVVINGNFSTMSGWTFSIDPGNNAMGIVVGQGMGYIGNSASVATASQAGIFTLGHNYIYNIEIDINSGTDLYILDGTQSLVSSGLTGSFSGTFSATSTGLSLIFNPGTHTPPMDIHALNMPFISIIDINATASIQNLRWYKILDNCCLYENFQLAFLNRLGGFEYWNFNKQSMKKLNITREEYRQQLPWNYSVGDRGYDILSTKVDETYQINSDWLNDYDSNFLQELLTSQQVYNIDPNGNLLPIIITDTSYQVKKVLRDQLFLLTVNFKYANPINIFNL